LRKLKRFETKNTLSKCGAIESDDVRLCEEKENVCARTRWKKYVLIYGDVQILPHGLLMDLVNNECEHLVARKREKTIIASGMFQNSNVSKS